MDSVNDVPGPGRERCRPVSDTSIAVTQQVEVPTTLTLAPPVTTQAEDPKNEAEVAKRQRITLGKNKSKGLLDNYSKYIVSVGESTSIVGNNIIVEEAHPRQKQASEMKSSFIQNPEGIHQVTEATVASPNVQGVFPLEVFSEQNPGGTSQVAEAKVVAPTAEGAFPSGSFPKVNKQTTAEGKRPSFIERVKKVLSFPASPIHLPPFKCKLTKEAAIQNFQLLKAHNGDIGKIIDNAPFSPMSIGSEFKPPDVLEPLLADHPSWPQLKESLLHGASCPIREMDKDTM